MSRHRVLVDNPVVGEAPPSPCIAEKPQMQLRVQGLVYLVPGMLVATLVHLRDGQWSVPRNLAGRVTLNRRGRNPQRARRATFVLHRSSHRHKRRLGGVLPHAGLGDVDNPCTWCFSSRVAMQQNASLSPLTFPWPLRSANDYDAACKAHEVRIA